MSCESTLWYPGGPCAVAPIAYAFERYAMPASSVARMRMIAVSVRRALRTDGSRNAVTPLLTASTPVIAVQPLEKACSRSHRLAVAVAAESAGGATTGSGRPPPSRDLAPPMTSTVKRQKTNEYVGEMQDAP